MDQIRTLKQMMEMNKLAFDNSYLMMMSTYEQNKLMLRTFMAQTEGMPADAKKAIEDWLQAYRKGCEDLKKMADEGYRMIAGQLAKAGR
jgi:predicted outer membrane protein